MIGEAGLTPEPYRCRECGFVGQANATILHDWLGHGMFRHILDDDETCQKCGSDDVREVDDEE
jgi:hypothetical protein